MVGFDIACHETIIIVCVINVLNLFLKTSLSVTTLPNEFITVMNIFLPTVIQVELLINYTVKMHCIKSDIIYQMTLDDNCHKQS